MDHGEKNASLWTVLGAIFAFFSVAAGAFGAHALKTRLPGDDLAIFEVAARYQMYHALALLAVGEWIAPRSPVLGRAVGLLFTAGVVLFSGSLYILTLTGARWLGAITPLGGACFLSGWLIVAVGAVRSGTGGAART